MQNPGHLYVDRTFALSVPPQMRSRLKAPTPMPTVRVDTAWQHYLGRLWCLFQRH